MKKLKKYYKWIIIAVIIIVISVLLGLIYKNLFQEGPNKRLDGIEEYVLTKKEITDVKENLNELDGVSSIDINTNYKIIKIFLELEKNLNFEEVKKISNESINKISEENLSFYDVEIFVECLEESEVYPKIGYKYKSDSEFTWNR